MDTKSATVGFNKGDGVTSHSLPGSFSPTARALSCGGRNGCYTFRVDRPNYVEPRTSNSSTSSTGSVTSSSSSSSSGSASASRPPTSSASATCSQTSSSASSTGPPVALSADLYSGSGSRRDECAHGLLALYPFGQATGDSVGPNGDDVVFSVQWAGAPFNFFGVPYNVLFPSTNGVRV